METTFPATLDKRSKLQINGKRIRSCHQVQPLWQDVKLGTTLFNRYLLLKKMGSGGFADVYKARDLYGGKTVAVKVSSRPKLKERNILEARMLRRLAKSDSPLRQYVVDLKGYYELENGVVVLVMELLSKDLLSEITSSRRPDLATLADYAKQMLEFLCFTWSSDVIHGDIKPENIMFESGTHNLKFIDFGLAQYSTDEERLYSIQTLYYRAPEVILGFRYGRSADLWSVGCVLLECLTKTIFFQVEDETEMLQAMEMMIDAVPQDIVEVSPRRHFFYDFDDETRLWSFRGLSADEPVGVKRFLAGYFAASGGAGDSDGEAAFADLVERLLSIHPDDRGTPQQLLRHPFVALAPDRDADDGKSTCRCFLS